MPPARNVKLWLEGTRWPKPRFHTEKRTIFDYFPALTSRDLMAAIVELTKHGEWCLDPNFMYAMKRPDKLFKIETERTFRFAKREGFVVFSLPTSLWWPLFHFRISSLLFFVFCWSKLKEFFFCFLFFVFLLVHAEVLSTDDSKTISECPVTLSHNRKSKNSKSEKGQPPMAHGNTQNAYNYQALLSS